MINNITRDHVTGFAIGVGVSALGFYVYKKNQDKVDGFLRKNGINVEAPRNNLQNMSLEELALHKEYIEDLMAEKELESNDLAVSQPQELVEE
ncbi:hypothetical protein [Oceanirhabdus sp. W0125-5]|uniref:hypothetical protein n=1 Tax=Oceanirhabdus sp. W0125-5 TaxID=2999116 RepID=UPI0022F2DC32|nr:hypothetical protein [Oceanirhabdus sp. W0125-5]WBW95038.1 hypothetical protein OW730_15225 [Oceanirhabdus sp. W0125-5]